MTGANIAILMKRTNNQKTMSKVLINTKEVRNLLEIVLIEFRPRRTWWNGWNAWNGRTRRNANGRNEWHGRNARHGHVENDAINVNGITRRSWFWWWRRWWFGWPRPRGRNWIKIRRSWKGCWKSWGSGWRKNWRNLMI